MQNSEVDARILLNIECVNCIKEAAVVSVLKYTRNQAQRNSGCLGSNQKVHYSHSTNTTFVHTEGAYTITVTFFDAFTVHESSEEYH